RGPGRRRRRRRAARGLRRPHRAGPPDPPDTRLRGRHAESGPVLLELPVLHPARGPLAVRRLHALPAPPPAGGLLQLVGGAGGLIASSVRERTAEGATLRPPRLFQRRSENVSHARTSPLRRPVWKASTRCVEVPCVNGSGTAAPPLRRCR